MKKIYCILIIIGVITLISCKERTDYSKIDTAPAKEQSHFKCDLRPFMSTVKHQGFRNTCSVFAATALVEYLIKNETGLDIDLSEQYNYWAAKEYTLCNDYLAGIYENIDALAGYLALEAYRFGAVLETEWKYEEKNPAQSGSSQCMEMPVKQCFTGSPPKDISLAPFKAETVFIEIEEIGSFILREKKPVIMNILWYPGCIDNSSGKFSLPDPQNTGEEPQGHVILLVGYDREKREFIFRNSWGSEWGDSGYGTIPEDYILKYYEASLYEPFDEYDEEIRDFLESASKGVSARLILLNN